MSNQLNVSVLVAARDEYSGQLKRHLQPFIYEGFLSIYEEAVEEDKYNPLKQFQIFLKQVPNWNQTILDMETTRIKNKCPYLMDMVTAIFVSHVKILASVRLGGKHSNIKIKIPTPEIFIHSVYVAGAECFYYNPELFDDSNNRNNMERIRGIIGSNIDNTISEMIPIQSILQEYLCNTFTDHVKPEPKQEDPIDEFDNTGDILSGNDIMDGIDDPNKNDNYESSDNTSDLSGLFTTPKENTEDDVIFPIGDTTSFDNKIKDDYKDDYKDESKEIICSDGFDFLGLDGSDSDNDSHHDSSNNDTDIKNIQDFNDDIPIDQDNGGFNEPSAMESDFNFFDNNDVL